MMCNKYLKFCDLTVIKTTLRLLRPQGFLNPFSKKKKLSILLSEDCHILV